MNKKILLPFLALGVLSTCVIADDGWYLTRKSPHQANYELENRTTSIRDLITDCTERSISLSCHRAGVWFISKGDSRGGFREAKGYKYLNNACTLGRGYSCRLLGTIYQEKGETKKAMEYFYKGCFRKDNKSCTLYHDVPDTKKPKITAFDKLQSILGD